MLTSIDPTPVDLVNVTYVGIQRAVISWSPPSLPPSLIAQDINQTYTLTVTSSNTQPDKIINVHQPIYLFVAPEDAPLCEVYNISVTTSYTGATYAGDDCSVPSQILSGMLPSLPDIQISQAGYCNSKV